MLIQSLILGFLISISVSYWNNINFKNNLVGHSLDIIILSTLIFFSLEYFKENIVALLMLFILLTFYLYYIRFKLFTVFSINKKQLNVEKDYKDAFNEKLNIFSSNIGKEYEFFIVNNNVYIDERLLTLDSKTLSYLINFFKIVQPKKSVKQLIFSLIPFSLFYLGSLNNDNKNYFFIFGGISIFLLQSYNKYFFYSFELQKLSNDNRELLGESLKKFKTLLDYDKENFVYSMKIQKALNEISKV